MEEAMQRHKIHL